MNKKFVELLKAKIEEFLMTKGTDKDEWYISDLDACSHILSEFIKVLDPKLDLEDFINKVNKRRCKEEYKRIDEEAKENAKKKWPGFKGQSVDNIT